MLTDINKYNEESHCSSGYIRGFVFVSMCLLPFKSFAWATAPVVKPSALLTFFFFIENFHQGRKTK